MYSKIDQVTKRVETVVRDTGSIIDPVRQSLFRRFPVFATLLVTFGVTATFFGIERIITEIAWLNDRPLLILILGILALVTSGKLYQKLG